MNGQQQLAVRQQVTRQMKHPKLYGLKQKIIRATKIGSRK